MPVDSRVCFCFYIILMSADACEKDGGSIVCVWYEANSECKSDDRQNGVENEALAELFGRE